jgi:hypothetical protein
MLSAAFYIIMGLVLASFIFFIYAAREAYTISHQRDLLKKKIQELNQLKKVVRFDSNHFASFYEKISDSDSSVDLAKASTEEIVLN